jgi:hypothetical protein
MAVSTDQSLRAASFVRRRRPFVVMVVFAFSPNVVVDNFGAVFRHGSFAREKSALQCELQ